MPKAELQRRIDNLPGDFEFFDTSFLDPTRTMGIDAPTGITVTAVQDGVYIEVDPNIDTAHLHPRFRNFVVHVRTAGSTDTVGMYVGEFSDMDYIWKPRDSGYRAWEVALTAVTNTGVESDYSDWHRCVISTFYDDFADYGGDEVSDLSSLFWLKIAAFEADEAWAYAGSADDWKDTTYVREGKYALRIEPDPLNNSAYLNVSLDLSADGRFGDDDYVCISVYVLNQSSLANDEYFSILFYAPGANTFYYNWAKADLVEGWNHLKVLKSDFDEDGAPDWGSVNALYVASNIGAGSPVYMYVDDWRIVKADPDDADTFNDTGAAWDFSDGVWHVYPGNRPGEPALAYSLGQIEGPSGDYDDFMAVIQNVKLPANNVSVGVTLKDTDGRAGIAFRIEDDTLGSEDALMAEVNTSTNVVHLVRYTAGVRTTLASNTFISAPNRTVWIGVDFQDSANAQLIKVYATHDPTRLFQSSALKLSHTTTAPWPDGQEVGLITYSANVRFSEFRAGSPQTADYAHRAGHALTAGYSVEDYGAAVARRVALPSTVGVWSMGSVQRSTGDVYDSSAQGRTLSYNGNPTFDFLDSAAPYINLDGTGDYLARTDETDLDVLGTESLVAAARRGLTLICWAYTTTANTEHVIGKWTAGTNNKSYRIVNAAGTWQGQVSTDGSANTNVSGASATTGQWWFLALRFDPSATLDLWCGTALDVVKYTNSTSIPASIYNGNADFRIGAEGGGGNLLTGYAGLSSLHFSALDDEIIEWIFRGERSLFVS